MKKYESCTVEIGEWCNKHQSKHEKTTDTFKESWQPLNKERETLLHRHCKCCGERFQPTRKWQVFKNKDHQNNFNNAKYRNKTD